MAPIKVIKRARCVFHHAENKGDAQPPLRNAGGCPLQGERLCSHHRRQDSEVRPHIRSATVLPGPRAVLQSCHMLQVRFYLSLRKMFKRNEMGGWNLQQWKRKMFCLVFFCKLEIVLIIIAICIGQHEIKTTKNEKTKNLINLG